MAMLRCPHCGFSKDLPEDKLPKKAMQVTCPKCREPFAYTPQSAAAPPPPAAQAPAEVAKPEPIKKLAEQVTITCPHCNHKREIPRAKVPPRSIRVTCPACQKPFPFDGGRFRSDIDLQQPQLHPTLAPTAPKKAPLSRRKTLASIGELFSRSWQMFTRRILTLIGINLLGFALAFVCTLVLGGVLDKLQELSGHNPLVTIPATIIMLVFSLAVGSAIAGGMTYAIVDETIGVRESLGYGIQRWRSFIWLFLLLGFILSGGYMAFFIPGLLFTVWFIFAPFVLAHEDVTGMDALLLSRTYVRGHGWAVLGRLMLLGVINTVLSMIPIIGIFISLLLTPFTLIYYHEIFRDLHAIKAPAIYNNARGEKAKYLLAGVAGHLVIPLLLFIFAAPMLLQGVDLLRMQMSGTSTVTSHYSDSPDSRGTSTAMVGSLLLKRFNFAPGETINVTFVAPPGLPDDAWIGIVPSDVEHGDESRNDRNDLAYQYLNGRTSDTLQFEAPQQPGDYDLRMHNTDTLGREIASVSFRVAVGRAQSPATAQPPSTAPPAAVSTTEPEPPPAASGPQLRTDQSSYHGGETIVLHFSGVTNAALKDRVGLYRVGTDDSSPIETRYLAQKSQGELHFSVPPLPGNYEFRLFLDSNGGQAAVATSQQIRIDSSP